MSIGCPMVFNGFTHDINFFLRKPNFKPVILTHNPRRSEVMDFPSFTQTDVMISSYDISHFHIHIKKRRQTKAFLHYLTYMILAMSFVKRCIMGDNILLHILLKVVWNVTSVLHVKNISWDDEAECRQWQ